MISMTMEFRKPDEGKTHVPAGLIVPLYFGPNGAWTKLVEESCKHPEIPIVAVINPANGPGMDIDLGYAMGVRLLQSSGIVVLGYVHTKYGARNATVVKNEVDLYADWYDVDGILFDEMANARGQESYYSGLTMYVKARGMSMTVGNPGTDTLVSYADTVDNLILYDNPDLPPESLFGGWHLKFDTKKFSFVSYDVNAVHHRSLKTLMAKVGYFFVTDGSLDNPWGKLPSYFDELVILVNSARAVAKQKI